MSGKIAGLLSFVDSEILALSEETLNELQENTNYPHFIKRLHDRKPYQLSTEVEQVLATLTPTLRSPFELYGTTKSLDIDFESFEHNGVTYPLDYATFENEYEDHPDVEFRRRVLKHLVMLYVNIKIQRQLHITCKCNKRN